MTAASGARLHRKMMDKVIRKVGIIALLKKCVYPKCEVHKMSTQKKKVLEELDKTGWTYTRQTASHLIFHHPIRKGIITVPVNLDHRGLTHKIMNDIKNGSKYERRELKGAHPMPQTKGDRMQTQIPSDAPIATAEVKTTAPTPTLPFPIAPPGIVHESWKQFPDYQDYEISNEGGVRRTWRTLAAGRTKLLNPMHVDILMQTRNGKEVAGVSLSRGDRYVRVALANAVATAFLMPPPKDMAIPTVAHKNGDRRDCRVTNLKWISRSDLMGDAKQKLAEKAGLQEAVKATEPKQPKSRYSVNQKDAHTMKFTDDQRIEAATRFTKGHSLDRVAKFLDCSAPTARRVLVEGLMPGEYEQLSKMRPTARKNAAKIAKRDAKRAERAPAPSADFTPRGETPTLQPVPQPAPQLAASAPLDIPATLPASTRINPDALRAMIAPQFSLTDIMSMKIGAEDGEAMATLKLKANSPTFLLLCSWSAPKG